MRKLTRFVATSSFAALMMFSSQSVFALGLGKLNVDSNLGQPLRLIIQLDSISSVEAETLNVSMGSRSDFARADVEYPDLGEPILFDLIEGDDGRLQVLVTTQNPVKETYLHFLVSATWSGGKAVKEYTALLDPPLYSGNQPAAVELANEAESPPDPVSTSSLQTPAAAVAAVSVSGSGSDTESRSLSANSIRVSRGDTLSEIVNGMNKPGDVDYFQALEAVYRKNPSAFIDSNMNLLRSGVTLNVPTFEEMRAISRSESVASFSEQLERFNEYRGLIAQKQAEESTDTLDKLIEDAESVAAEEKVAEELAGLTTVVEEEVTESIVEPEPAIEAELPEEVTEATLTVGQDVESDAIVGAGDNAAQIEAVKQQLAQLDENLLAEGVESESVRQSIKQLQQQVDQISTLIDVEDTSLANLQNRLAATDELSDDPQDLADPESGELLEEESVESSIAQIDQSAIDASIDASQQTITQEEAEEVIEEPLTEESVAQIAMQEETVAATDPEASVEEQIATEAEENIVAQSDNLAEVVDAADDQSTQSEDTQEIAAVAAVSGTDATGTDDAATDAADDSADVPRQKAKGGSAIDSAIQSFANLGVVDKIKGSVSSLTDYGPKILLGLLGLLLGLFLWQRQKTRREYDASMLDIETEEVSLNSEASIQRMSDASGIDLASANDSALELTIGGGMSYLSEQGITGVNEEDNEVIKAGAVDPLAEADVYLAYDRDEQAIQVLREAYSDNPERGELAEKLLEIFHKQDDRRAFDEMAAELHQQADSTQNFNWDRVVAMGKEVSPDNPLYSGEAPAKSEKIDSNSALDLDDDLLDDNDRPSASRVTTAAGGLSVDTGGLDVLSIGAESTATAVEDLEIDDLEIDLNTRQSDDARSGIDAPTLSQIINENVEGRLNLSSEDDSPEEINLVTAGLDLNLGGDDDQKFNMIEEESKLAVEEAEEGDTDPLPSALDKASSMSSMSEVSESQLSQLEPYHESETALELAKAYLELGEQEIAKGFIEEVLNEGSEKQKGKARNLIKELTS